MLLRTITFAAVVAVFLLGSGPATASPAITRAEWASYLHQDTGLKDADERLNATYRTIMGTLGAAEKDILRQQQRAWIHERNNAAFARQPKGSPGYLKFLAEATLAREAVLRTKYTVPPPVIPVKQAAPEPPRQTPRRAEPSAPAKSETKDLAINVAPQVRASAKPGKIARIDTTPALFGGSYNALAQSFNTVPFPSSPARVTGNPPQRTENYAVTDNISILFNYVETFDKPETITFQGRRFLSGTPRERDEIAYALVMLLKTLSQDPKKTDADRDAEISGLMRGIKTAFSNDATRIWRNNGLLYVISYVRQADLFSMTVRVDGAKSAR